MLDEIKKIDSEITALRKKRDDLIKQYITENCPVKVGKIVAVNGYSHEGKKMIVDNVTLKKAFIDDEYYFFATGRVLKKDNTPGTYRGEWHSDMEPK